MRVVVVVGLATVVVVGLVVLAVICRAVSAAVGAAVGVAVWLAAGVVIGPAVGAPVVGMFRAVVVVELAGTVVAVAVIAAGGQLVVGGTGGSIVSITVAIPDGVATEVVITRVTGVSGRATGRTAAGCMAPVVMLGCVIGAAVVTMVSVVVSVAGWGAASLVEGLVCYAGGLSVAMEGAVPWFIQNIRKYALFTGIEVRVGGVRGVGGAHVCLEHLLRMAPGRESLARGSGFGYVLV